MSETPEITLEYVAELERKLAALEAEKAALQDERNQVAGQVTKIEAQNRQLAAHLKVSEMLRTDLERMLKHERRARWGVKSEKLNEDQKHLPFEDIEVIQGMLELASDEIEKVTRKGSRQPKTRQSTKGNLPGHLPREDVVIEPQTTLCPCGCGQMDHIGEDVAERLDIIPAQFRVIRTIRPKYMCRSCDGKSHAQAPAPEYLVPRVLPTERLISHVIVAKFGDYLPFYRQSDIYRRQGVDLDRSVLGNWAGRGAHMLMPVIDAMIAELAKSDRLFCDETTVPVLAPGTKKTRKDFLWAVMRDQRGWGGSDPPIVVFHHSQSRSAETARSIFQGYTAGTLTVDGYTAYDSLADPKKTNTPWQLSFCWTHWRRKFVEFSRTTPSPICEEMLSHIASLYKIEAEIRGKPPETRKAVRQRLSKPVLDALRPWLEARVSDLSETSDLTKAIKYGLKRWDGLTRFVDDGRVEMDTNLVENAIRPIPLTRKNALFAGNEAGARTWARLASLIGTCKLNGIDPAKYIEATLRKILDQHMARDIPDLMPWNFKPDGPVYA